MKSQVQSPLLTVGDLIPLKNYEMKSLDPMFKGHFRIIAIKGN